MVVDFRVTSKPIKTLNTLVPERLKIVLNAVVTCLKKTLHACCVVCVWCVCVMCVVWCVYVMWCVWCVCGVVWPWMIPRSECGQWPRSSGRGRLLLPHTAPPSPQQIVIGDQVLGHLASWEEKTLLWSFQGGIWTSWSKFQRADFVSIKE